MGNLVIGTAKPADEVKKNTYVDFSMVARPNGNYEFAPDPQLSAYRAILEKEKEGEIELIATEDEPGVGSREVELKTASGWAKRKILHYTKGMTAKYEVRELTDIDAVQNALHQCFSWIPGERVLLPEFGSRLQALLYSGITPATEEKIVAEIRHCISEWEPRVEIEQVVNASTVKDTENNTIRLQVVYHIKGLDGQHFTYEHLYNKSHD